MLSTTPPLSVGWFLQVMAIVGGKKNRKYKNPYFENIKHLQNLVNPSLTAPSMYKDGKHSNEL